MVTMGHNCFHNHARPRIPVYPVYTWYTVQFLKALLFFLKTIPIWIVNYVVTLIIREGDYFNKGITSDNHQSLVSGDTWGVRKSCSAISCELLWISLRRALAVLLTQCQKWHFCVFPPLTHSIFATWIT